MLLWGEASWVFILPFGFRFGVWGLVVLLVSAFVELWVQG